MTYSNTSAAIEALAAEIGEQVYLDIAKWHLYLGDAKLHTPLAEKFYPMLKDNQLEEKKVLDILRSTPIKLGGGRHEVALIDLLPMQCQVSLMDLLEDYQRKL
ncbi:MAG: DUF3181 family protein [Leptolyngbyaceae cyanobacterium SM1_1_3]|nr:DUF3181 family protein [Leptolyngbyaceae cyanobacterium SM1_1_3]NJM85784.1 DUF3181 family protein [Leptolyngbyaceae cyanobacterium RM2_2_21]NJN02468.1 DUF3181 family protein [Leptolyngbyaceae cyanobacterium RM1_1_2]NJO10185.1 DUF3181 family protein [Leptolyngbyaceae cyanobacterium SL_1_1]